MLLVALTVCNSRNKLDHCALGPLATKSATRKVDDNTTLVFTVKADKRPITQAVKKPCDSDVAKVSTLIRPDEEKAHVQPAPNCDALEFANKV